MKKIGLRYNERSWAIDIISFINHQVVSGDSIQRASGEYSLSAEGQTLFPDVLLFGDHSSGNILQGWELKMPDTPIDDEELIKNASIKARNLGLNSFLVWNALEARLYIYDSKVNSFFQEPNFNFRNDLIKSRIDVQNRQDIWQHDAKEIIKKLNEYFSTGKIKAVSPEMVFSDEGLINQVLSCQSEVCDFLIQQVRKDKKIDASVKAWWKYVHLEYPGYDSPFHPLAYCIIFRWFNRFVYANILKAYNRIILDQSIININTSIQSALSIFEEISEKSDYWNILAPSEFDEYLPENVWKKLIDIFHVMTEFEFSKINKSVLGEIIKSAVLTSIKKAAGLYSTPRYVAELLVRLSLNEKDGHVIDPFCGTGTIVKSILEIKSDYNIDGQAAIKTTWACDKFAFPIQVATLAIASPEIMFEPLHIFTHDAFTLKVGEKISLINPSTGKRQEKTIPEFSAIISNFPFVQFEDIAELNPVVISKINNFYEKYNIPIEERLDGRSDLYSYIPFLLYELLKGEGYLGIVISNSWLATKAGKKFRKLLCKHYSIEYIVSSGVEKWFNNTDVVTNLVICKKINKCLSKDNELTTFVTINKKLSEIDSLEDLATDIITNNYYSTLVTLSTYNKKQLDDIEKLGLSWNSCFGNILWLTENIDKFDLLSSYTDIGRGERRGWDKLFYPSEDQIALIEDEYLRPILKTSKGKFNYIIEADSYAFCCGASLKELKQRKHNGALSWIRKFEHQLNGKGKPLVEILARPNLLWYEMTSDTMADFVLSMNPDTRIFIQRLKTSTFINQRLIRISNINEYDLDFLHALLNSTIVLSQIEGLGFGRGLGVLDLSPTNLKTGLYIPQMGLFSEQDKKEINSCFKAMIKKPILPINEELERDDRKKLDSLILKGLNLNTEIIEQIYKSFLKMYHIRKAVDK